MIRLQEIRTPQSGLNGSSRHGDYLGYEQVISAVFVGTQLVDGEIGASSDPEGKLVIVERPPRPKLCCQPVPSGKMVLPFIKPGGGPVQIRNRPRRY